MSIVPADWSHNKLVLPPLVYMSCASLAVGPVMVLRPCAGLALSGLHALLLAHQPEQRGSSQLVSFSCFFPSVAI